MAIADVTDQPISELVSLAGRTAVVTGAARGIGAAIARRLAEAGAHVVVSDVNSDQATEAAAAIVAGGGRASARDLDVTDETEVIAFLDRVTQELGPIDVWVNNAGIYPFSDVLSTSTQEWDRVLDIDLRAVFIASREVARRMVRAGRGGVIVNISSGSGLYASPGMAAHYCVAKAGVIMLTRVLALELGKYGIRALSIAPGLVLTPGIDEHPQYKDADAQRSPDLPLGRSCVPDDVARVVLFCASDLAKDMTGDVLPVDGGGSMA